MRTVITDDGAKLRVLVRGAGPPLVLLHGWAADHSVWLPLVSELVHRHTVYSWDARGHGLHPAAGTEPVTLARMARDLRAVLEHFGLDRPVLVGHSMGALALWQTVTGTGAAGLGPLCIIDQTPRLVTDSDWRLGIYGDWDEARNQRFLAEARADFSETVLRLIAEGHNAKARQAYQANSRGIQRMRTALSACQPEPLLVCWESLTRADFRAALPAMAMPTLLVYGGASNYYDLDTARYVAGALPAAELHVFEGADHSPHVSERMRFLALLEEFIDRNYHGRA